MKEIASGIASSNLSENNLQYGLYAQQFGKWQKRKKP